MYDLSVVIPTHNRVDHLPGLFARLAAQDYPADKWEVVVVNDGSVDATREYLESGEGSRPLNLRVIHQPQGGVSRARNNGAKNARGRGILFLDDDMLAAPTLVREHALVHQEDPCAVVIGHISVPDSGRHPWVAWEDRHLSRHYTALESGKRTPGPRDFYTGNVSVSASLFNKLGGFDPNLPRTEDLEFGYRSAAQGARFYYRRGADSLHLGQHTFEGWVRNARLYGEADVLLAWEKGHIELQKNIFEWFHARRSFSRTLVEVFDAHPRWLKPSVILLNITGRVAYAVRATRISHASYGIIYHLSYWLRLIQVMGQKQFWAGVNAARHGTQVEYDPA